MVVWKQTVRSIVVIATVLMLLPAVALAAQSSSTSYQVNEVFFGAGGELNSCSTNYCSKQSAGETTVGHTCSNGAVGYCAEAGFNTDRYPYIQFVVGSTNINLGSLTATSTKTATANFSVKAYLSHGYTVFNASDPPTNGSYTMQAITGIPAASSVGTEQFGINLVRNVATGSASFGQDPQYVPDATFSHGAVSPDYSDPDHFKYEKGTTGGTVAYSTASSSATDYTVSYMFNISNITPGGSYLFRHILVATATY